MEEDTSFICSVDRDFHPAQEPAKIFFLSVELILFVVSIYI